MGPAGEISMVLEMHLRHHSRLQWVPISLCFLLPSRHSTVTQTVSEYTGGVLTISHKAITTRTKSVAHKQENGDVLIWQWPHSVLQPSTPSLDRFYQKLLIIKKII